LLYVAVAVIVTVSPIFRVVVDAVTARLVTVTGAATAVVTVVGMVGLFPPLPPHAATATNAITTTRSREAILNRSHLN
jgi:hypothetical protein